MQSPVPRSEGPELCLKFTDTVDWRTSNHSKDRLQSYGDLVKWSERRGLIEEKETESLLRLAENGAAACADTLERARVLRETIYTIFSCAAHGKRADRADIRILNGFLVRAMSKVEIQTTDTGYRLGWCAEEAADKMLYPVAKSAAELLTSEDLARVKECANEEEGCGSLFLDASKSHSRRWCSMESCGNRAKLKTYYARHRRSTVKGT